MGDAERESGILTPARLLSRTCSASRRIFGKKSSERKGGIAPWLWAAGPAEARRRLPVLQADTRRRAVCGLRELAAGRSVPAATCHKVRSSQCGEEATELARLL